MTFLHASLAAAGFACVAIPIIIHFLFRNRRRPIQWAAMRFLLEALRKQRRRLRLEQLILLATRCLLLAALAAAIARPLLERAGLIGGTTGRVVYFVIDNSLTASIRNDAATETTLDRHKKLAREQLAALAPGDRAGLVTLAAPSEPLIVPASADLRAVTSVLDSITPTDARADIAGAFDAIATRLRADAESGNAPPSTQIVLLSEFLRGSVDLSRPLSQAFAGLSNVTLTAPEPAQQSTSNVQITAVEPLHALVVTGSAGNTQDAPVRVMLRRSGSGNAGTAVSNVRLGLADPQQRFRRPPVTTPVRWQPGQTEASVTIQLNTDPGQAAESAPSAGPRSQTSELLIAELDRDSLDADNTFRRPMNVRDAVQVGIVAQRQFGRTVGSIDRLSAAEWLRLALRPTDAAPIEIVDIEPSNIDAVVLATLDAVFVPAPDLVPVEAWPRLRAFVDNAGLLVVSPSTDATVHLWTDAFTKAMGLDWRIAREPRDAGDAPLGLNPEPRPSTLFALLEPELQPLLKPVSINRVLGFQEPPQNADTLLALRDNEPWLIAAVPGGNEAGSRGLVLYLASAPALSWTDLPARPLMVPLIQEIVKQGVGRAVGGSTAIAGDPIVAPASPTGVRELRRIGDDQTRIEIDQSKLARTPIRTAGVYTAIDEAGRNVGTLAINADASAGLVEAQDPASIREWLAAAWGAGADESPEVAVTFISPDQASSVALPSDQGAGISVPLLMAAVALALLETAFARWFSHARREPSRSAVEPSPA